MNTNNIRECWTLSLLTFRMMYWFHEIDSFITTSVDWNFNNNSTWMKYVSFVFFFLLFFESTILYSLTVIICQLLHIRHIYTDMISIDNISLTIFLYCMIPFIQFHGCMVSSVMDWFLSFFAQNLYWQIVHFQKTMEVF